MFPRAFRLSRRQDFTRVYRRGQNVSRPPVLLRYAAAPKREQLRIGLVVPNRVAPKSTRRNRLKRILRAALQSKLFHLPRGFDLVITLQDGTVTATQLRKTLTQALEQFRRRIRS